MDEMKINEILKHYSPEAQTVKALEELAELQAELAKMLNGHGDRNALQSEMADAVIMICQMMIIYDIDCDDLDGEMAFKLDRQLKRIAEETHEIRTDIHACDRTEPEQIDWTTYSEAVEERSE